MTIEKMKEWLEAMEKSLPRLAPYGEQDWLDSKAAITSLRQAIAEAEGQEKALQALHNENERLGLYKDAYAEQEPVAWMDEEMTCIFFDAERPEPFDFDFWKPLYATPPQRKPLTDEELEAMAVKHVTNCYFDTLKFARAIEAAHGIKGEA